MNGSVFPFDDFKQLASSDPKILIVGYEQPGQMGNYLAAASGALGLNCRLVDLGRAETSNRFVQKFYWHLRGKRPANLAHFASEVLDICSTERPSIVLTTGGRAPLERWHIEKLQAAGLTVVNYSTDDPWNPALLAPWFLSALPAYDAIFTPRRSNIDDFHKCGAHNIHYVPFGYDPHVHFPWADETQTAAPSDILFVGGCDKERLPLIAALVGAGFELALFGRYWDSHAATRSFSRGVASQSIIRSASASASICLCLVRRANRDGHVMRSFEAAAIGGCILAEETQDHRDLFGPDGEAVRYFKSTQDLVRVARDMIADADGRARMSIQLRDRMAKRNDTYADRLKAMLSLSRHNEFRSFQSSAL
jgi:spore maturation protein CgeB